MKKTLILLGILIGLIIMINIGDRLSEKSKTTEFFKGLNSKEITKITLKDKDLKEVLKKEDDTWYSTEHGKYKADSSKITDIINILKDQKKTVPVSKNPKTYDKLGLDSASAKEVIVDANKKYTFYIGDLTQGFTGNYIRLKGEDEVYVSNENFGRIFQARKNYYRDKRIFTLNKDNITGFDIVYKKTDDKSKKVHIKANFDMKEGKWFITQPEKCKGDLKKINSYLAKFADLKANDWYEDDASVNPGFEDPELKAVFYKSDGSEIVFKAGSEKDGKYYSMVKGDDNKYMVLSYYLNELKKSLKELKAEEKKQESEPTKEDVPSIIPGSQGTFPSDN